MNDLMMKISKGVFDTFENIKETEEAENL